jgi:hypothetical protein
VQVSDLDIAKTTPDRATITERNLPPGPRVFRNRREGGGEAHFAGLKAGESDTVTDKNEAESRRIEQRLKDQVKRLEDKLQASNQQAQQQPLCNPEAGLRQLELWAKRHQLQDLIQLRLEGGQIELERQQKAIAKHLELAGCYVITTDVPGAGMASQQVHDSYMALQRVERDLRAMKTGSLEGRPIFGPKASRTRGQVFCCMLALKLVREIEQRLRAVFGTTWDDPYAVTLPDALAALSQLCLLNYPTRKSGAVVPKLPHPNDTQSKILHALSVNLPKM